MSGQYLGCSIELAFSDEGEGLLDEWVPREVQALPPEGFYYQPNRYYRWALYEEGEHPIREGVIYTKYCSRKLTKTWWREAERRRLELIYLVESTRGMRHADPQIRYVVAPVYGEKEERLRIRLGLRISMWPRGRVEIAIEQGGVILNPNGTAFDSLEDYDRYMESYNQMKARTKQKASE
jgi:hypothetical protein